VTAKFEISCVVETGHELTDGPPSIVFVVLGPRVEPSTNPEPGAKVGDHDPLSKAYGKRQAIATSQSLAMQKKKTGKTNENT
jgi:hypothetical protein